MQIKLTGIGQCGSFIVYDVLSFLFDEKTSEELRAIRLAEWKQDIIRFLNATRMPIHKIMSMAQRYFTGQKVSEFPSFFVVDGNKHNVVVDGLSEVHQRMDELHVYVNALPLSIQNSGCALGQIGEYYFRKEQQEVPNSRVFDQLGRNAGNTDANIIVFAGGGGSGSGGAVVLNEKLSNRESLLINMIILPPFKSSAKRIKWNVGRCIARLATAKKHTTLLLFSNLSEEPEDQFTVNQYVRELIIRMANFGYPGNVPKIGADMDRMDLKIFFAGKPAFVGLSSMEKSDPDEHAIEKWVDLALSARRHKDREGLSIEVPDEEQDLLNKVTKVMVVVGIPENFDKQKPIAEKIKNRLASRLGQLISEIDFEIYSYGSVNKLELTIFFRHDSYRPNFLLTHFLDYYFKWHKGEKKEYEYLTKEIPDEIEDTYIEEVRQVVEAEIEEVRQVAEITATDYFDFELKPVT